MKKLQIEFLENYFKTENEHWNEYTFKLMCEVLQHQVFENPEQPLKLFQIGTSAFIENPKSPLKAFNQFKDELDKETSFTPIQRLFVVKWVHKYIQDSEFEGTTLTEAIELLKGEKKRLQREIEPDKPITSNLRETLKTLIQKELEHLPEMLKDLKPAERLTVICKLMPFILPRVEQVSMNQGEPLQW